MAITLIFYQWRTYFDIFTIQFKFIDSLVWWPPTNQADNMGALCYLKKSHGT